MAQAFPFGWLRACALLAAVLFPHAAGAAAPQTERHYLSGHSPKDAVPWDFSVSAGRRAGEWTTIPVPSNWEQHGFGNYAYGESPQPNDEHGLYRLRFAVPPAWKGRTIKLVFEGVMTDATIKLNGKPAGPTHVGGFYRFAYDVTGNVTLGAAPVNLLEVDVAKTSANKFTAKAENKGDYWMFGGIFRPVWLESTPPQAIEHTAIDARADGSLLAEVTLAGAKPGATVEAQVVGADGGKVGKPFAATVGGAPGKLELRTTIVKPRLWSAETPNLYTLRLSLRQGRTVLHASTERFGFRTFEVRKGDGLYLNGKRILIKGVNRHSFRPDTARALTPEDSYADARLIKEMNMNTARMSHYPPDPAFLQAADELGLYVLNELSGWQAAHDTEVGRRLVREMITRDVNHPSILFWDNGNEGGWNRELDKEYDVYDPQKRKVLHPWELFSEVDTKHYPSYQDLSRRLKGPHLVMPTEMLHGLYDGGGGSGLDDYWKAITTSPFGAGAIFWVFADEGIARTDKNGKVDVFSTYAPDGLVGPRHEKEASFYTVRELWSPVQVEAPVLDAQFGGTLNVSNHYDFTSLAATRFRWQLVRFAGPLDAKGADKVLASGQLKGPALAPGGKGALDLGLPAGWRKHGADALQLVAYGHDGKLLSNWSWATPALAERLAAPARATGTVARHIAEHVMGMSVGELSATFDPATGMLLSLRRGGQLAALANGPRLVYARPKSAGKPEWLAFAVEDKANGLYQLAAPRLANTIEIDADFKKTAYGSFKLELSPDGQRWTTVFDASRREGDGKTYDFPPQPVHAVRLSGMRGAEGQAITPGALRLGYAAARFPGPFEFASSHSSGAAADGKSAWLEVKGGAGLGSVRWTMHANGELQLDYTYALEGDFLYHGITFDHPEAAIKSVRWLGKGPYRSWQNRQHGSWLGVHDNPYAALQPGESWAFPESQGFFAGVRWARLGALTLTAPAGETHLRLGTPRISHVNTSVEFPAGDLSLMHAIPAMGEKFVPADQLGPGGAAARASGQYQGRVVFRLE
jgi:hypothetical protein